VGSGLLKAFLTFAAAAAGGLLFSILDISAAWLVGSTLATVLLSIGRFSVTVIPQVRDASFVVLGIALGSGVTPDFGAMLIGNWFSFFVLVLVIISILATNTLILIKVFGVDPPTAIIGTSPGATSMTIAMTESGFGDARAVAILQSVRLALLVTLIPIVIQLSGVPATYETEPSKTMPFLLLIAVAVISGLVGYLYKRFRMPAAWLLGGVCISSVAHGTGIVNGNIPTWVTAVALVILGTNIGSKFVGVKVAELSRYGLASVVTTLSATLIAFVFAWVVSVNTSISIVDFFLSYSPGGVEAMVALSLVMSTNPSFVAAHHVFRIVLLTLGMPTALLVLKRAFPSLARKMDN
jgi:uncharacterized protein